MSNREGCTVTLGWWDLAISQGLQLWRRQNIFIQKIFNVRKWFSDELLCWRNIFITERQVVWRNWESIMAIMRRRSDCKRSAKFLHCKFLQIFPWFSKKQTICCKLEEGFSQLNWTQRGWKQVKVCFLFWTPVSKSVLSIVIFSLNIHLNSDLIKWEQMIEKSSQW